MARSVRKEIRRPDTLQVYGAKALEWTYANRKALIGGVSALVAAAALFWGYRLWRESVENRASLAYSLAATAAPGGDGPKVAQALEKVARDYPGARAGIMARLRLAGLLKDEGKLPEAEAHYRAVLEGRAATETDRELARRGLAAILEARGKCGEAIAIWRDIIARGSVFTAEDLYVAIGACQERQGKDAAALKTYEELAQKYPSSPFLTPALRGRMGRLAKGGSRPKPKP